MNTGAGLQCDAAIRGRCDNRTFHPYRPIEQTILDYQLEQAIEPAAARLVTPEIQARRDTIERDLTTARAGFEMAFRVLGASESATVKAKIEEAAARVDTLEAERDTLGRQIALARGAVSQDEHITAIRRLRAGAEQTDDLPARREARLRIQSALRGVIEAIVCNADHSYRLIFRAWKTPAHSMRLEVQLNVESRRKRPVGGLLMTVALRGQPERKVSIELGILAPTLFLAGIILMEKEGKTLFDREPD